LRLLVPARLTTHPSLGPSRTFVVRDGEERIVGRDPECGVVLEDPRVSGRHAAVTGTGDGWRLLDLNSKNGTLVDGARITEFQLADDHWISLGGLLVRFQAFAETDGDLQAERTRRFETSVESLRSAADPEMLLRRILRSVLDLADAERGLLLLVDAQGRLTAELAAGFEPDEVLGDRFAGSVGAVAEALATSRSVVVSDARSDPRIGGRDSVAAKGIGALICVPIKLDERASGVLYADGPRRGTPFSDLDLETLEAFAEEAALVLGSLRLDRRIRELLGERLEAPSRPAARFLGALEERLSSA
jgi:hypothetical protein